MEQMNEGAVFVQTERGAQRVIAFARGADGSLSKTGTYSTGGAGDDTPHLTSQGSVTLTRDRRHLLVTNVASGDVSVFARNASALELTKTVPVGPAPKSVAEHEGLVFVLTTARRDHGSASSTATSCRWTAGCARSRLRAAPRSGSRLTAAR